MAEAIGYALGQWDALTLFMTDPHLPTLIATCEANEVNPADYLADVLLRVQTHPASRIDELLPHNLKPPTPEPST